MRLFYLFLFETRNKFSYDIVKYFIHRKRKRFLVNRFIWSQLNIYIYIYTICLLFFYFVLGKIRNQIYVIIIFMILFILSGIL